jgi:chromosome segregation ATPase
MDSTELDLKNTLLTSLSNTTSNPDDYEKDLRLAAELGRCLLERNHELQNYINVLQKQLDDKQCDMKLLHTKFLSTREQLDAKCKQTEILDATNFDLEQELAIQRRENDKNRQHIKELCDLYEKTHKQCHDIEHEYETFRTKQFSSYFLPKQTNSSYQTPIFSTPISTKRQRSNSFSIKSISDSPSFISSNLFDISSTTVFKSHLSELKSRIHSLTIECTKLNDQLHRSEQDKCYLIDHITQLERQYRDDNDSLQNELNHYRKLVEKSTNDNTKFLLSNIYSPPEHDLSLYDEVLLENKQLKSSYQPTNYKDLFASVYEKLKTK